MEVKRNVHARPHIPWERGCYSFIKLRFSGSSREISWEAACTGHTVTERDPPTSVTTSPSGKVQAGIAAVKKEETVYAGGAVLEQSIFLAIRRGIPSFCCVAFVPQTRPFIHCWQSEKNFPVLHQLYRAQLQHTSLFHIISSSGFSREGANTWYLTTCFAMISIFDTFEDLSGGWWG